MTNPGQIIIRTSKKKLIRIILLSAVIVANGLWIILDKPLETTNSFFNSEYLKYSIGGLSILFFGFILIYFLIKLADKKHGLVIDNNGITENVSAVAVGGQIPWDEIESIRTIKVWREKWITIVLKDPQKYIDQQKNTLKRKLLISNFKKNGSPIGISSSVLAIKHDELVQLLEKRLSNHKISG